MPNSKNKQLNIFFFLFFFWKKSSVSSNQINQYHGYVTQTMEDQITLDLQGIE
jgi:hypothetical protein